MDYVLDTSILIELDNDNQNVINSITKKINDLDFTEFYITFFNLCEYYYGHIKKNKKNKEKIKSNLSKYKLLNTSCDSALTFCDLKNVLKRKGADIPVFDLLISSIVMTNNMTLITRDKHFTKVPGLKVMIV